MKLKTARRFIQRKAWKVAKDLKIREVKNSDTRRYKKAKKVLCYEK